MIMVIVSKVSPLAYENMANVIKIHFWYNKFEPLSFKITVNFQMDPILKDPDLPGEI